MTEHGREHTDGSRSGGQPLVITRKAHTAVLEVLAEWGIEPSSATAPQLTIATTEALCRAIEQHEDFAQEVSDAVERLFDAILLPDIFQDILSCFIIPAKPDPRVEALTKAGCGMPEIDAEELRAALEACGLEIREKHDD